MKRFEYNIYTRDGYNASGKAKEDVSAILSKHGYQKLYNPSHNRIVRVIQQLFAIVFLPPKSELFIQYQSNIPFFYSMLSKMRWIRKTAIIHDLESLRGMMSVKNEVKLLNGFDVIISHNPQMTQYLINIGVEKKILNLNIFDYLLDDKLKINMMYDKNTIFFAGNLMKSKFLKQLRELNNLNFYLYGADFDGIEEIKAQSNVYYKGSFSPDELISNIEGGWGLVWDGDSLDTCSGVTGEYLKYNNPHKVSMCIVSERPVIVWSKSAMADYILEKKLGIVVDSLFLVHSLLESVTEMQYKELINNVQAEKRRLIRGQNLEEVLYKSKKQ